MSYDKWIGKIDKLISIKCFKKYLPDIFILGGLWIFIYVLFFPIRGGFTGIVIPRVGGYSYNYSDEVKFIGIIIITLGIDIAIRRFIAYRYKIKNERKN